MAHGFEGGRFFPPTIQTDDPFAVDELAFPTISTFKNPANDSNPATRETDVGFEFSKEISPKFALGFSEGYANLAPDGGASVHGFGNLTVNAKYQLWENAPHEAIFSVGAEWEIGGTGAKRIGADSASTLTPTIYFGKGFGDLPDALDYAKPFALTGTIGESFPTNAAPNNLEWAFALEYSLPYLQSHVKDFGLPAPFKNMIPLVEFSFETPENRGGGPTTGTINPGILWGNQHLQVGAEAIIPVNSATGKEVGAIVKVQIFIDD
ncbi:MAG: hypothetical protein KGJ37_05170, partial [Verrucomicrobiota bacterium]|nr:hypothetical protein [Verrucomicrobiota bacterium]